MRISKRVLVLLLFTVFSLAGCNSNSPEEADLADLVVYGKIFTSEANQIVEAFAVKDGKYIYLCRR